MLKKVKMDSSAFGFGKNPDKGDVLMMFARKRR